MTLAAGTRIQLTIEDKIAPGTTGQELRPLAIPSPASMPFVDPASPPDALYAFMPFEATFSQPATLTFRNRAALPAGAAVDVLAMKGLVASPAPAGPFVHVATAHVTSDGSAIALDAGEGVSGLTWIALRKM